MRRPALHRLCFSLVLLVACVSTAAADEVVGRYAATGVDPQGRNYKGDVQIEQIGKLHVVLWKLEGSAAYKGIGIRQGDKLGVGYAGPGTKFGIAVYKVSGGTLEGVWADSGDLKSELGKETLEGSPDLTGTYKIALGQNRDGMTNYTGKIEVKRNGNTFLFYWPTKVPSLGVGVLIDDMLVVAYGSNPAKLPGVVAYKSSGADTMDGIWAFLNLQKSSSGSVNVAPPQKAGTETLKRQP
jgi:hypothetical protein